MVDAVLPASFSLLAGIGGALTMSGSVPANQSIVVNYGEATASAIPDAANLRVFLDGDDIDGAANTTLTSGSAFASWLNKGTLGGTFTQGTAANQPLFIASLLNGRGGARFDGTNDRLVSSLAASTFTFLHDGTGCTVYAVVRTTTSAVQTVASTKGTAASSRGLMIGLNTTFRASVQMSDGVALQAAITGANNTLTTSKFDVYAVRLSSSSMRANVNTVSVGSVTPTAVSGLAPAGALNIGSNASPASFLNGDLLAVLVYGADHDSTMLAAVQAYLSTKYAATFPA